MSNNFNANELNEIITEINSAEIETKKYIKNIISAISSIVRITSSNDSLLSDSCNKLNNSYLEVLTKISGNLNDVKEGIDSYKEKTINNEEDATHSISNIHSDLDSLKDILKDI